MPNGGKTMSNTHRPKSARPFVNRSKQWTSHAPRTEPRGFKTRREVMNGISR